tara:strand:- start:327 stop:488 length:162 start_codon:yes stop_codon:yes gene_type:complete
MEFNSDIKTLKGISQKLDLTDENTVLALDLICKFDEKTILKIINKVKKQTGQG